MTEIELLDFCFYLVAKVSKFYVTLCQPRSEVKISVTLKKQNKKKKV